MSDNTEWLKPGGQPGLLGCRGVVREMAWHDRDEAGRADMREALGRAEQRMSEQLRYYPAPVYLDETLEWPRFYDGRLMRSGPWASDGRWLSVRLSTGHIQAVGVEARTSNIIGAAVTYTDEDGDGYKELATIGPLATTLTNVKEVAVYFSSGDRFGYDNNLDERWRIAPLNISISGGQITIKGPAWIFVRPVLYSGVNVRDIDPNAVVSPFASTVDIYRRFTDTNGLTTDVSQGVIIWETRPLCCGGINDPFTGSPNDPAATAQAVARVGIRDSKGGFVTPASSVFNATTGIWSSLNDWTCTDEPDRVTIRYLAGYPVESDGLMNRKFRGIVVALAAAELGRPISGCAEANRLLFYWQQDLAKTGSEKDLYATSADILDNPFGTRRGHVYAWHQIQSLARGTGIRVG